MLKKSKDASPSYLILGCRDILVIHLNGSFFSKMRHKFSFALVTATYMSLFISSVLFTLRASISSSGIFSTISGAKTDFALPKTQGKTLITLPSSSFGLEIAFTLKYSWRILFSEHRSSLRLPIITLFHSKPLDLCIVRIFTPSLSPGILMPPSFVSSIIRPLTVAGRDIDIA